MRIPLPKLLAPLVAALTLLPAAPAMAEDPIVVTGSGWGHGIGLPQYGAKGQADAGSNHEQILQYFYTGAQFGYVGSQFTSYAEPLHIGVGLNQTVATFQAINGALTVGFNGSVYTPLPGEVWQLQRDGFGNCHLYKNWALVGSSPGCPVEIAWPDQPNVRVYFHELNRTYARGKVIFKPNSATTFHTIVEVPMEAYLLGLAEVPNSWPIEALKAQVIAARTFALYKAWTYSTFLRSDCLCHLHGSTVDQAYRGWGPTFGEGGSSGDKWIAAVQSTAGKAMWHPQHGSSRALEAYYFSSSGGATENNEEVWGGSPYAYLRSRPDPWSANPAINPNASWTSSFSPTQIASAFGFSHINRVVVIARNTSGSARTVEISGVVGPTPTTIHVAAGTFRSRLGMKSQYFSVDWVGVPVFPKGSDRPALHDPTSGQWIYRDIGSTTTIYYGNPGDHAFMGDWNCDGVDTPGLYRRSDGFVYLRNSNTQGVADIAFFFGNPGDLPIAGDFNNNGCDTVSIYRPSEARFYIINRLGQNGGGLGAADDSYLYGNHGDVPFMGDWNGDGIDTPGLRRNSNGFVYLRNSNTQGVADIAYFYGNAGDLVFAGDWNANGIDTLGLYRPSNGFIYLRNTNDTGVAHIAYEMGGPGHKPVAGAR